MKKATGTTPSSSCPSTVRPPSAQAPKAASSERTTYTRYFPRILLSTSWPAPLRPKLAKSRCNGELAFFLGHGISRQRPQSNECYVCAALGSEDASDKLG